MNTSKPVELIKFLCLATMSKDIYSKTNAIGYLLVNHTKRK